MESKAKEIYASGLPASYSEEQFKELFVPHCTKGTIVSCKYKKHVVGSQTGFGFVRFSDADDAQQAMNLLNGTNIDGETIRVVDSSPPDYKTSDKNLYIEGLPLDWGEPDLRGLFETHGELTEVRILINKKTNDKTGVGFVHFSKPEEAHSAKDALDGTQAVEGADKTLTIRFANQGARKRSGGRRGGFNRGYRGWRGPPGPQSWGMPYNPYQQHPGNWYMNMYQRQYGGGGWGGRGGGNSYQPY